MKDLDLDLAPLLGSWKYEDGKNVRRVKLRGDREVLQVRLPLGIEQYELHGRPDGSRPHDEESWFHYYQRRAEKAPWDFNLDEESFDRLYQESLLYYYRYLLFFQINEYKLCARDTLRNLHVLEFVSKHGAREMAVLLEQYRPYILRMHVMARALQRCRDQDDLEGALELLRRGQDAIRRLPPLQGNEVFRLERSRSLKSLTDLHDQLKEQLPPSPARQLRERLQDAVREEDYEEAARIRDEISRLDKQSKRR